MNGNTASQHEIKAEVQRWFIIILLAIAAYNLEDSIVPSILLIAIAATALAGAVQTWRGRDE